jgi:hypothetical protein
MMPKYLFCRFFVATLLVYFTATTLTYANQSYQDNSTFKPATEIETADLNMQQQKSVTIRFANRADQVYEITRTPEQRVLIQHCDYSHGLGCKTIGREDGYSELQLKNRLHKLNKYRWLRNAVGFPFGVACASFLGLATGTTFTEDLKMAELSAIIGAVVGMPLTLAVFNSLLPHFSSARSSLNDVWIANYLIDDFILKRGEITLRKSPEVFHKYLMTALKPLN